MSSTASTELPAAAELSDPAWLQSLLGVALPTEGGAVDIRGQRFVRRDGILRCQSILSAAQRQTSDAFTFKWHKRATFEGGVSRQMRAWLVERYGDMAAADWLWELGEHPILLDAGCGGGMSGLELFGPVLSRMRYLGVDVSGAVEVAKARFAERRLEGAFLQADLQQLPLSNTSVDLIFSEGVLHHCDSTEAALKALARHLKPGGRFLFYVYRKKGPIREFTDDYVRDKLQAMAPEEAWEALMPLSKLGKALGEIDIDIELPEPIDVLDIPAGRINVQRLFYWHVLKAFYAPELSLDEMNHINYDWHAPKNAHRQTPEEVRRWCGEAGLEIEHEVLEPSGITIIAHKAP